MFKVFTKTALLYFGILDRRGWNEYVDLLGSPVRCSQGISVTFRFWTSRRCLGRSCIDPSKMNLGRLDKSSSTTCGPGTMRRHPCTKALIPNRARNTGRLVYHQPPGSGNLNRLSSLQCFRFNVTVRMGTSKQTANTMPMHWRVCLYCTTGILHYTDVRVTLGFASSRLAPAANLGAQF